MPLHHSQWPAGVRDALRRGVVIPAHPLVLDSSRALDERRQRALSRYYIEAGAGGLAVGVHTTQFAIRDHGLYAPVLSLAAETARDWAAEALMLVAGIAGRTAQAVAEAKTAAGLGYHAGLVNVAALKGEPEAAILEHCAAVAAEIPVFGFYLLPEVGGVKLSSAFWRDLAAMDNVVAIKIAPFNRYGTVDVVRGVVEAGAEDRIMLYTGNDDHIVLDLLAPFVAVREGKPVEVRLVGGLLGHWSFWTRRAVEQLDRIHRTIAENRVESDLLALDSMITDANNAIYDGINDLAGCIPGCHEVLRRQGLLEGIWCLNPAETLSPGQATEIDRVIAACPQLNDDAFVAANRDRWLDAAPAEARFAATGD